MPLRTRGSSFSDHSWKTTRLNEMPIHMCACIPFHYNAHLQNKFIKTHRLGCCHFCKKWCVNQLQRRIRIILRRLGNRARTARNFTFPFDRSGAFVNTANNKVCSLTHTSFNPTSCPTWTFCRRLTNPRISILREIWNDLTYANF